MTAAAAFQNFWANLDVPKAWKEAKKFNEITVSEKYYFSGRVSPSPLVESCL
jgi:hypothetical protein